MHLQLIHYWVVLALAFHNVTCEKPKRINLFPRQNFREPDNQAVAVAFSTTAAAAASTTAVVTSFTTAAAPILVTVTSTSAAAATSTATADELVEPFNFTLDGKIFPPAVKIGDATIPQDFSINCLNCFIDGKLSLAAGGSIDDHEFYPPADFNDSAFDFENFWVGAAFPSLEAEFELSLNLTTSTNGNDELIIPLESFTKSITYDEVLTLTVTVDFEIHGSLDSANNVNFTQGFNFSIPPWSKVLIDLENPGNSSSLGFNASQLTPVPLTATRDDLNVSVELSLRAIITFEAVASVIGTGGALTATVGLDAPKFDIKIDQVHNVTFTCDPASEHTPQDEIYNNLTSVVPSFGFHLFEVSNETGRVLFYPKSEGQSFSQDPYNRNIITTCLYYDKAKETFAAVSSVKAPNPSSAGRARAPSFGICIMFLIVLLAMSG